MSQKELKKIIIYNNNNEKRTKYLEKLVFQM